MTTATSHHNQTPVLLLHPNLNGYRHSLQDFLDGAARRPIYTTVEYSGTDAAAFCEIVRAAIIRQGSLGLAEVSSAHSPADWASVAAHDLAKIAPFMLFIDAVDLLDADAVLPVLRVLAANLPADSQIVLKSRYLPHKLLRDAVLQSYISLTPIDEALMLIDYQKIQPNSILLEVHGLGPGRALINGVPINDWDGTLPRTLFLYLVDHGMATRDDIFRTYWPEVSVKEATNVFHVTKRKISEILGFDLTAYVSGYYQLSPAIELRYDVVNFIELIHNSSILEGDEAIAMLEKAVQLYRSDFLTSMNIPWVRDRRAKLRSMFVEALQSLGSLYETRGDRERATGYYARAHSMGLE